jgi:shikimate dehydrogenase
MKIYGLIGYPLSHSLSQQYFDEKFRNEQIRDCMYELFPLSNLSGLLPLITQNESISGLNVTIPYKERIMDYLDEMDEISGEVGAVNCISVIRSPGGLYLKGYNTDVRGFELAIRPWLEKHHRNALVLGTGGSAKAVTFALKRKGLHVMKVSRHPENEDETGYESLTRELLDKYTLIVNATPLGMAPNAENCPSIPYEFLHVGHLLFDLIYNPVETMFMKKGKAQGATAVNGIEMFYQQAEKSWEIWSL